MLFKCYEVINSARVGKRVGRGGLGKRRWKEQQGVKWMGKAIRRLGVLTGCEAAGISSVNWRNSFASLPADSNTTLTQILTLSPQKCFQVSNMFWTVISRNFRALSGGMQWDWIHPPPLVNWTTLHFCQCALLLEAAVLLICDSDSMDLSVPLS